jgi:hypothetical protein
MNVKQGHARTALPGIGPFSPRVALCYTQARAALRIFVKPYHAEEIFGRDKLASSDWDARFWRPSPEKPDYRKLGFCPLTENPPSRASTETLTGRWGGSTLPRVELKMPINYDHGGLPSMLTNIRWGSRISMHTVKRSDDELTWTAAEKKVARRAFDKAFEAQCGAIEAEVKRMIASASTPSDIWRVHDYLSERRRTVDRIYDYRYSVLLLVFARLLRDGWLMEADLAGFHKVKIDSIKLSASL